VKVFEHRRDQNYLGVLYRRLDIKGEDGLVVRAVPIRTPFSEEGRTYDKCCRIDFAGIAPDILFDYGANTTDGHVASLVKDVFRNANMMNERGIFIKMRLLLVYPYSAYALAHIQAEMTSNRSSIEEPVYPRNLDIVESVDEQMFMQSPFVISQIQALKQIQDWVDQVQWDNTTVNRVMVRFVPASPDFCLLIINDTAFIDPYLLAKKRRAQRGCVQLAPLVQIDQSESPDTFAAIDDHFRYLWDLDLTMYCRDATYYVPGQQHSLARFRPPTKISFDSKAAKTKEKKPDLTEEAITKWKSRSRRVINRFCIVPAPTPSSDSLFITCSWRTEDGQSFPHRYARQVSDYLETDFGRRRREPLLSVFIMEAVAGEFFTQQLYARMDESTLALILMTADVEARDGSKHARPNVYHEMGYLMKHLGGSRVAIVCEQGVAVPTNIHDVIRIDFQTDKLILVYAKIAGWVIRSAELGPNVASEITRNIKTRLDQALQEGQITSRECRIAKDSIGNFLKIDESHSPRT